jgi:hypothetical protein
MTDQQKATTADEPFDLAKAIERVFTMGQDYLADADSESYSRNRKSDVTLEKFRALKAELLDRLRSSPQRDEESTAQEAAPVAWRSRANSGQPWEKFDEDIEEHTSPVTDPAVLRAIGEGLKGAATDTPASAVAEPVSDKEIYWLGQAIEAAYQNGSNTLGDELDALRDKLHSAAPPPIARSDADEDLRSLAAQRTHERDEERARVGRILGLVDAALCAVDSLPQSEERDDARKKLRAMFDAGKYTARSDADDGKSIADAFEDAWDGKLHPDTRYLVAAFANALAEKLAAAEEKYGYTNGWADKGWMDECRAQLIEHVVKGDPRDVAAYCAFLWYHGERTAVDAAPVAQEVSDAMTVGNILKMLGAVHRGDADEPTTRAIAEKAAVAISALQALLNGALAAAQPFDTRSPCGDPNVTVAARDAVTAEPTMFVRAKGGAE